MNSEMQNEIDIFLNKIKIAGEKISHISKKVIDADKKIHSYIESFNNEINLIKIENNENEFAKILEETIYHYKKKSEIWLKAINSYINGKEFINKFETSVLFVVFGNVNVGKSSIGNFIAQSDYYITKNENDIPRFFTYDMAEGSLKEPIELDERKFRENNVEETTTIQYYTIKDGLTWVDSPGIHSINSENEELAKKYVEYADLVLFVTTSASPAKYDEYLEISRLIQSKKPLLVVINKSDKIEKDEVDDKIIKVMVPKSDKDRQSQENYVKEVFLSGNKLNYAQSVDSVSLSTALSKEAINNDSYEKFIQSGYNLFYKKLGQLLDEEAIELKMNAPKQRVNSLIDEVINGNDQVEGLNKIKTVFLDIIKNIDMKISEIVDLKKSIANSTRTRSMSEIDNLISKEALNIDDNSNEKVINLSEEIRKIIIKNYNEILQSKITSIIRNYEVERISELDINIDANIKGKYENVSYTQYYLKEVGRAPSGLIEKVQSFFGKKFTTVKTKETTVTKTVKIGDNSSTVIDDIFSVLNKDLQVIVENHLENIATAYFEREKEIANLFIDKINLLENNLQKEYI